MHVLIIDDELEEDSSRVELLRDYGITVTVVNDADAVPGMLNDSGARFDAVILDLMMPPKHYGLKQTDGGRLTGIAIYREIIEQVPTLPVVIVSAGRATDIIGSLRPIGYFLEKPVSNKWIVDFINDKVNKNSG